MIIVMKQNAPDSAIEHVIRRVEAAGLRTHVSRGAVRTIIGCIGDEQVIAQIPFIAMPFVEKVMPVLSPYKIASREFHPEDTVVTVGNVKIGGGTLTLMAGPCAVESRESLMGSARGVRDAGAHILRGGAFKPRTSPYDFQGLGEEGLKLLREAGMALGMPTITEVRTLAHVPVASKYADILQIGARNMQNFDLLREVGQARKPVMLKRGMANTVHEMLMAAEYILSEGNPDVMLCERGVRTFETATRFTLDVAAVPTVKQSSHLPVLVDPSHAAGKSYLVPALARAGIAAGADGVIVEVHVAPEEALCDGQQALTPSEFAALAAELRAIHEVLRRLAGEGGGSSNGRCRDRDAACRGGA